MTAKFKLIGIFGNQQASDVEQVFVSVTDILKSRRINYIRYQLSALPTEEFRGLDDDDLDLAIVVGGDGTFMNVARMRAGCRAPLLGINLGRRGFLTDVSVKEIYESLTKVLNAEFSTESRTLLVVNTTRPSGKNVSRLALNDIVVNRTNYGRLLDFEISVDGTVITHLRADGVIVSTPTGSTAYALSSGGPVLFPTLPAIEIIPMSPQTLTYRPIVLSDSCTIGIKLISATSGHSCLTVDGHVRDELRGDENIMVKRSDLTVDFIRIAGHTYFKTLRQKLGWGI